MCTYHATSKLLVCQVITRHCVTKREGPKSHNTLNACTTPSVHVFLIFFTQFRPLLFHNTLTAYWLFQTHITRSEMYKCFISTQQQDRFHIIHPLPRPFTQMPAKETLSSQTIYIARMHKPDFHQMFTKPDSQCCLVSLSRIPLQQLG
jgi:hypothetical protein